MIKKSFFTLLFLLAAFAAVHGQSSQTGTLMGVVTMEDGVSIPGVTVTAASPALVIGKMSAVTNENGVYRFANLPPGVYELDFQLEGFRPYVRKDVRVAALQTFTVNATIRQEAIKEAIVVTGQSPTVDTQRQTRAANFDVQFLKSLPAPRNLANFINMAPGLIADDVNGGSSASGSATMDNSVNLDGVNLGDPATGLQNITFGLDIMDEISVQTGGLSAEYGSVRGAMVNVVTKSGGNRVSGAASFYFNHESLVGNNRKGTVLEDEGLTGNHRQFEPSFSIGGPVVKDKLWFFASATYKDTQRFVSGFPYNKPDPAAIKITQPLPYIKFTFQPNQKNKFTLSYNYSDQLNNNRFADRYHTENNTSKQTTPTHVINANWNRYFGENMYVNFKVGVSRFDMNLDSNLDAPFYYDLYTYNYLDNGGNWRTQDHNSRDRYNVNVDATTFIDDFMGTHELKVGGEAQLARVGWLVYGKADPKTGCHYNGMLGESGIYYLGLVLQGDGFNRKDNMDDYFAFVQDTWRVNRHLTLNLGLRLEYNSLTWPKQGDGGAITLPGALSGLTVNRTVTEPIKGLSWTTLAPRLGLIYDVTGDNKTLAKVSWSRYTMPNQVGWVNEAHPNGWITYFIDLEPDGTPIPNTERPLWLPSSTRVGYEDYKLSAPYTDELTLGLEREIFTDWSAGARFIRKWDRNLMHMVDAAQLDMDKLMASGELDWSKNWIAKTATDPFDGKTVTFYSKIDTVAKECHIVNPPGAERDFSGLELTLNKRFSHGWALNTSYVYGKSEGLISQGRVGSALGTSSLFQDPNAHVNAYGTLDLDSRHQFKMQGVWAGPLGINLSGYFRFLSGGTYTRTITSRYLGVSVSQSRSGAVINAEERGSRRLPDTVQLDLRLEKAFKIKNVTLAAFADCFNVFNQGIATTVWTNSSNPAYEFERMLTINTPRMFQLGARIEFN
ncbi:MAG TPA: TonB-dependent receptor [Candidatus Aminicenantes bacterium]|nr:TonB-dependent receptor [Candidatus Aminicenantes bacterium]